MPLLQRFTMPLSQLFSQLVQMPSRLDHSLSNPEPFRLSSLTVGNVIRSSILALSIVHFIFIPFSGEVFHAVIDCSWISLLLYILFEQASLFALRSLTPLLSMLCVIGITAVRFSGLFLPTASIFITLTRDYSIPVSLILDATTSAGILILGCNATKPKSRLEAIYLVVVGVHMYLNFMGNTIHIPVVLVKCASWENIRLLASFLYLRLAVGTILNIIVIGITREWALRGQVCGPAGSCRGFEEEETRVLVIEKADNEKGLQDLEARIIERGSSMRFVVNLSVLLIVLLLLALVFLAWILLLVALFHGGIYVMRSLVQS